MADDSKGGGFEKTKSKFIWCRFVDTSNKSGAPSPRSP